MMANSIYIEKHEYEESEIMPSTQKNPEFPWQIFNSDKIKVIRKEFFTNVVSNISSTALENEGYLRLFQKSGLRFYFLNEFLSFDYRTELYAPLD